MRMRAQVHALQGVRAGHHLDRFASEVVRQGAVSLKKSATKLHALLDLRGATPAFTHMSDGKLHDVNLLDIPPV